MEQKLRPVFQSLNRPLTLLGLPRKHFFLLITFALTVFQVTGALLPALVLFIPALTALRAIDRIDPELLRIVLQSGRLAVRYDPAKEAEKGADLNARSARAA